MQLLIGKTSQAIDGGSVAAWAAAYEAVTLDLGCGDGAYVRHLATSNPSVAVIGIDTCGANAIGTARRLPENARLIVHDALAVPGELAGLAGAITINFPWGSLLRAMLDGDDRLLATLRGKQCEIRVNAGALAEQGYAFEPGIAAIRVSLRKLSPARLTVEMLDRQELRSFPSTWAKRLAFGRDPRAVAFRVLGLKSQATNTRLIR
jgi:16S rRNA (adenine(1408)-N(1))-methyltransferase